jgi:hypothetical protein
MIKLKDLLTEEFDKKRIKQIDPLIKDAWRYLADLEKRVANRKKHVKRMSLRAKEWVDLGKPDVASSSIELKTAIEILEMDCESIIRVLKTIAEKVEKLRKGK